MCQNEDHCHFPKPTALGIYLAVNLCDLAYHYTEN